MWSQLIPGTEPPWNVSGTLKFNCAANQWQGPLSCTASTHLEKVGLGQFGERCWQECHLSKTHPEKWEQHAIKAALTRAR